MNELKEFMMKNLIKRYRETEDKLRQMRRFHPIKIGIRAIQIGGLVSLLGMASGGIFMGLGVQNQMRIAENSRDIQEFNEGVERYHKQSIIDDCARVSVYTALGGALILGAGVIGTTQYISYKKN